MSRSIPLRARCLFNFWVFFAALSGSGLVAVSADEFNTATVTATAFARVIEEPSLVNLPEWPKISLSDSVITAINNSNKETPFLFSFGGSPYSLYTVSLDQNGSSLYFELSNGTESIGFFDETGLQSLRLKMLLAEALSNLTGESLDQIEIVIEHN